MKCFIMFIILAASLILIAAKPYYNNGYTNPNTTNGGSLYPRLPTNYNEGNYLNSNQRTQFPNSNNYQQNPGYPFNNNQGTQFPNTNNYHQNPGYPSNNNQGTQFPNANNYHQNPGYPSNYNQGTQFPNANNYHQNPGYNIYRPQPPYNIYNQSHGGVQPFGTQNRPYPSGNSQQFKGNNQRFGQNVPRYNGTKSMNHTRPFNGGYRQQPINQYQHVNGYQQHGY